jgi:hypothetical protein
MKTVLLKALFLVAWFVPACATVAIALPVLLAWFSPAHLYLSFFIVLFTVSVFQWLMLAYIAFSKRFGIGWHWLVAATASLLAVEFSRIALSGIVDVKQIADVIRNSCFISAEETLSQVQRLAMTCGITSWFSIASAAFIQTITAGLFLALAAWVYRYLVTCFARYEK